MLYFISDTHFGHESIIRLCNRPFNSVDDMNACMLDNWRKTVGSRDKVYILGDLFYKCKDIGIILKSLTGIKYLILGNHDNTWFHGYERYFAEISLVKTTATSRGNAVLCHYPWVSWPNQNKSYMIHGHIHNSVDGECYSYLSGNKRILNASVEINGYKPCTIDELISNNGGC